MERKSIIVDKDLCYGCYTCQVACKQEHELGKGLSFVNVVEVEYLQGEDKVVKDFVPMMCKHCGDAPCIEACPVDAISKRSDGIVLIDEEVCIKCKKCIEACPFGAIQFTEEMVKKCNLCVDRVDKGLEPACVHHCPTGALKFGNPNELVKSFFEKVAEKMVQAEGSIKEETI